METIPPEPHLPPELECRIFEIAALASTPNIPKLMLVARRVKHWVEPLLYRVLVLSSMRRYSEHQLFGFPVITPSTLLRIIAANPPHFLQNAVKRIFVHEEILDEEMEMIFAACNHVSHYYTRYLPCAALARLHHLRRLTIRLADFLECCNWDSTHPVLANITHLDLLESWGEAMEGVCARLPLVSNLTHFAITSISFDVGFRTALCGNARLECIVFFDEVWRYEDSEKIPDVFVHDSRFVCMSQTTDCRLDWLHHTETGRDFWALAEAFIAAKRRGKVDRSCYTLSDEETSWLD
ncbi:hypothetical protein MSAN_02043700 [Mycena sanguinolenta]|uniref:Uncharacterized protein n=1 Tax=Mycena sanguinolenta TaxID=230812 RepID=A0A8H6XJY7_9AGAR|nr:hypothetical protein MSAN_02043700 [Mycena sanguinolenta]